jgi:glyoxylase-like metal-dependent hydrolase (beta-lactamase superfamily II)
MLHRDVVEGVHRVEEAYTNWYLVEDGGRVTVVDTGFPRSWATLHDSLATLGRSVGDVEAVVLTHAHFDHMGFAERARRDLGVPLYAHEKEVPVVRHPLRYDHEKPLPRYLLTQAHLRRVVAAMTARGAVFTRGSSEVKTFTADAELDVPGSLRTVFTPGHTYGHTAYHLPERGALIAGDAIVTVDPYTGRTGPAIVAGAATADSSLALRSLDALEATGARTVLTGHGDPWTGGVAEACERARAAGPA